VLPLLGWESRSTYQFQWLNLHGKQLLYSLYPSIFETFGIGSESHSNVEPSSSAGALFQLTKSLRSSSWVEVA